MRAGLKQKSLSCACLTHWSWGTPLFLLLRRAPQEPSPQTLPAHKQLGGVATAAVASGLMRHASNPPVRGQGVRTRNCHLHSPLRRCPFSQGQRTFLDSDKASPRPVPGAETRQPRGNSVPSTAHFLSVRTEHRELGSRDNLNVCPWRSEACHVHSNSRRPWVPCQEAQHLPFLPPLRSPHPGGSPRRTPTVAGQAGAWAAPARGPEPGSRGS